MTKLWVQKEKFILASASPRRRELLTSLGLEFDLKVSNCEELVLPNESPAEMVKRLAQLKAQSIADNNPNSWVLAADTTVVLEAEILNKPLDKADAVGMLGKLQAREHQVWGGICLINKSKAVSQIETDISRVWMRELTRDLIRRYVESGEPMDKAGSYAVQGIGAGLIERIEGSYTNVVGLNLAKVLKLMQRYEIIE